MAPSAPLRKAIADRLGSTPGLEDAQARLDAAYASATTRWPLLSLSPEGFVEFIAQRVPAESWPESLGSLHLEDLALACGCIRSDDNATAAFISEFGPKIDNIFRESSLVGLSAGDYRNRVVTHILVGKGGERPRIAKYGGTGALRYWVGVVAGRLLADLARARAGEESVPPARLDVLPAPDDSPEAAYLRHYYREQFEAAIEQAFAELEPRDRDLLRFYAVDKMPTPTIAALFDIHRGTAARWLKEARQKLLWATRDHLVDRFEVPRGELESILRLVQSQLDLSVRRLLQAEP